MCRKPVALETDIPYRRKIWSSLSAVSHHPKNGILKFTEPAVDAAANERDPLTRIAYVAAFAMSNYSSTFGRIAKPFNPMLVCNNTSHYTLPWANKD